MKHSEEFIALCNDIKTRVHELSVDEAEKKLQANTPPLLIDVRDADEFAESHIPHAKHLSKGWIEAKIHTITPDKKAPLLLYCGGGNRSALAADNLQKMGYSHVHSISGGFKAWLAAEKKVVSFEDLKTLLPIPIYQYLLKHSLREADVLKALREKTLTHPRQEMLAAPDEAQLLALLIHLTQAKRVIEVGIFTGYTTLAMAQALPPDGKVIACDITDEYPSIGKPFWQQAGVAHKIDLCIGSAIDTLQQLLTSGAQNQFDLIFIDADKQNYPHYFEAALQLIKPNGIVAIDNTLGAGESKPYDLNDHSGSAKALRQFNEVLYKDERVWISMLPIAEGLTLAVKK